MLGGGAFRIDTQDDNTTGTGHFIRWSKRQTGWLMVHGCILMLDDPTTLPQPDVLIFSSVAV